MRRYFSLLLTLLGSAIAFSQSLTIDSGNGQIVLEQFRTTLPLTVIARDASGHPAAGVPVTWSIPQGQGTVHANDSIDQITSKTDANGFASAYFVGTGVPFGYSFTQATVSASSSFGTASFFVTTALSRLQSGGQAALPLVELISPSSDNRVVSGRASAIVPAGVVVRVSIQSGPQTGQFLPNVAMQIQFYNDEEPQPAPFAQCRGNVLTNANGIATCDLVLNDHLGQVQLKAVLGQAQGTPPFLLTVQPGTPCTYSINPGSQSFSAVGGTGTIALTTGSGCNWAAASNASWAVLTGPVAGSTSANIGYAVSTNSGQARSAAITVGSQVFTLNQSAAGALSPLTILTTALPNGAIGSAYSASLAANGGTPVYHWRSSTLPAGLTLSDAGLITGVPSVSGTFSITATVTDSTGTSVNQNINLTVSSTSTSTGPQITNTSFPGGTVGQSYSQAISYTTYCTSPFGRPPSITLAGGSLPPGLSLTSPSFNAWAISGTPTSGGSFPFTLTITEPACAKSSSGNFTIAIGGSGGTTNPPPNGVILSSPPSVTFTVGAGSSVKPADVILNLTSSTGTVLRYTASVLPGTGGSWLTLADSGSGQTPSAVRLSASNFQTLSAGPYSAQLALQVSGYPTVYVQVTLSVTTAAPAIVSPPSLTFTSPAVQVPSSLQQSVQVNAASIVRFDVGFTTDSQFNWLGASPGSGTTPGFVTVVVNPVALQPGTYTGRVFINPIGGVPVTIPVSLIITAPPALSWSVPSVDNSYLTDGPSPLDISINLASSGSILQYQVSAPATPWLSMSPRTGLTPDNITFSFNPTGLAPGIYQTQVTAIAQGTPGVQPVSLPVTLSVRQSAPTISAILNAASFLPGNLAPGMEIQIVGSSLGPLTQADGTPDDNGVYPNSLAGARVLFDDFAAPVLHASDTQITVLVPYSIAGKTDVRVVAEYRFAQSVPQHFSAADSNPGLFTAAGTQGVIFNEDGSYNSDTSGANPGSVIGILGTGEGQTNPPGIDGMIMQDGSLASPALDVTAFINGAPAEVISATSSPGQPAGVFLIKVKVPDDAPRGTVVPVSVTIGTASSQSNVTMVIAP